MNDEIALFIDFENIRYSLINVQHREPDPQELIGVARRFGTVMVARAYADWTRQPEFFKGSLTAAMIDRVDCPAKVRERFRQFSQGQVNAYGSGPFGPGGYGAPMGPMGGPGLYGPGPFDRPGPRDLPHPDDEPYDDEHDPDMEARDDEREHAMDLRDEGADEMDDIAARETSRLDAGMLERDDGDDEGDEDEDDEEARRERGFVDTTGGVSSGGLIEPQQGYGAPGGYYGQGPQPVFTQSTVDLNMLMDIIETVFDRPSIGTFVLMTGDRDFTRICARLKLRLNKRVIVVGVPGTVSRDLISAAEQFVPLGYGGAPMPGGYQRRDNHPMASYSLPQGPVEPDEPGFIQFLDYIDRHWSWRTVGGISNFIGDPFNPKNRFRGRLTRESARDLLRACIDEGILIVSTDPMGGENLRLNREHPAVLAVFSDQPVQ